MTSTYDPAFDRLVMAAPIVDNASDRLWGANGQPDFETCPDCGGDGDGVRTVTRTHPFGLLDEDIDVDCGTCEATGRVQS